MPFPVSPEQAPGGHEPFPHPLARDVSADTSPYPAAESATATLARALASRDLLSMKIAILGASQGTGAEAAKAAALRGHQVTAFARTPEKLAFNHERLRRLRGNFHDRASVEQAVLGQDAVLVTASAGSLKGFRENPRYFSLGTGYAIDAMKKHGVRRLVVLSALGAGDSRRVMPFFVRLLLADFILKPTYEDHNRQEELVRQSGLDWVIVRPTLLTNGPARKRFVAKSEIERVPRSIARADVADFMVSAAESGAWLGRAVQIGG